MSFDHPEEVLEDRESYEAWEAQLSKENAMTTAPYDLPLQEVSHEKFLDLFAGTDIPLLDVTEIHYVAAENPNLITVTFLARTPDGAIMVIKDAPDGKVLDVVCKRSLVEIQPALPNNP